MKEKQEQERQVRCMLFTIAEVAKRLKVNRNTVYNLIKEGRLKAVKLGSIKVREKALEEFLDSLEEVEL